MRNEYGIQLYSVRDLSGKSLESALEAVSELGYKYVEFASFFENSAKDVLEMLEKNNLKVSGTHTGWNELAPENLSKLIEFHKTIGNKNIIIPGFDRSEQTLEKIIAYVNHAIPILREHGICVGYHNHSFEFETADYGKVIFDEIATRTAVDLEIDIFWAYDAGVDVIELIEKYKSRVKMIHLKDGFAKRETVSAKPEGKSLGLGNAPIKEVIEYAENNGILMVVESEGLEPSGIEEVARCMEFLKANG